MNHSDFVNEFQAAISKSDNQQIQALEKLLRKLTDEMQSTSITPWHEQQVLCCLI
jgi:mannitol/fructose-specific phosphotransferase system IIA component